MPLSIRIHHQVKHVLQVTTDRPMQVVLLHNVNSIAEYTRLSIILKDNFQRVTLYPEKFSNHVCSEMLRYIPLTRVYNIIHLQRITWNYIVENIENLED